MQLRTHKYKYVRGIICPLCEEKIWSVYGHDFHSCNCGYCYVDGGKHYLRVGWGGAEWPQDCQKPPKNVRIRVSLEEWLKSDRPKHSKWKLLDRFPY